MIVDESKLCKGLGPGFPVPVEITPFCHEHTGRLIAALPAIAPHLQEARLRLGTSSSNAVDGDEPAVTDNGNYIVSARVAADCCARHRLRRALIGAPPVILPPPPCP